MKNVNLGPIIRVAIMSLVLCGIMFPMVITCLAQILMPYQANGSLVQFKGRNAGSYLIAQNFTSPMFFQPRNASESASGVDPDITLQDAYSQVARIHNATGISTDDLRHLIEQNVERTVWVTGDPYVNVLKLNLLLTERYPSVYKSFN